MSQDDSKDIAEGFLQMAGEAAQVHRDMASGSLPVDWKARAEEAEKELAEYRAKFDTSRVTCAYCGDSKEAPATLEDLRAHVAECPKHPMVAVRVERDSAVEALGKCVEALEWYVGDDYVDTMDFESQVQEALTAARAVLKPDLRGAAARVAGALVETEPDVSGADDYPGLDVDEKPEGT